MEDNSTNQQRRRFLTGSAAMTGGLIISFYLPNKMGRALGAEPAKAAAVYPPNAFVQIAPDNTITIVINRLEMGQGVNTSMAQLIAEELECDWKSIRSVSAPVHPVYNAVGMPIQMTGGSNALRTSWDQHRMIGASMREMLKSAAAARWNVSVKDVRAENGFIVHAKGDLKFSYGDLAESAAKLPLPTNVPLKPSKNFKFIGKSMPRTDAIEKSNGQAVFGIDVRTPGMLYVAIARPSLESANLVSFNAKTASQMKGVSKVVRFGNKVAVLASNSHIARKACDTLVLNWDNGPHKNASDQSFMKNFKDAGKKTGIVTEERGRVEEVMKNAKDVLTLEYEFPFLAHATMEPMNCTVRFDGKTADIWSGHQMPTSDLMAASKALGLAPERINVHTVFAGGSFGRRASKTSDYVVEACALAKIVKKPIKVVWSREDDMRGGYYRPMNYHKVVLGLDDKANLIAWDHHVVGQSIIKGSPFEAFMPGPVEEPVVEGVHHTAYKLPVFRCQQTLLTTPVQSLWWRSVGNTHTAFVMETAIDELAEKSGKSVFEYRRRLLKDSPRHLSILDILERKLKSNEKSFSDGRAWGLAIHESFESVVGHLVDVSMVNGHPKVHRVWSAVHCGQVVNPENAKTQVEGGIVFGLSSLWQHIQLRGGEIVQKNFDTFPVLRIQDMPVVEVDFVPSNDPPTGLGEPGVPPAAPAVANAMYKLTQKRLRVLPFSPEAKG